MNDKTKPEIITFRASECVTISTWEYDDKILDSGMELTDILIDDGWALIEIKTLFLDSGCDWDISDEDEKCFNRKINNKSTQQ